MDLVLDDVWYMQLGAGLQQTGTLGDSRLTLFESSQDPEPT